MTIRFCERQTEQHDRPTACSIFHKGHKIYEHRPENPIHFVTFAAQGEHCYFYRMGAQAVRATTVRDPPISVRYACAKVRETFEPEHGRPFTEWEPFWKLQPLEAEGFRELRRPERHHETDEVRTRRETVYFYTKGDDLEEIYEELLAHQKELHGSEYCFALRRSYGNDAEKIAGLRINARELPSISIRAVPLCADDLVTIARLAGMTYRGNSLAKFEDEF